MFAKGKPIQPHLLRSLLAVATCHRESGISIYIAQYPVEFIPCL